MNLRKRFHLLFALIILVPLASMVTSFGVVWIAWSSQLETEGDLEAPRYLQPVLTSILSGDYDEKKIAEKGVILLLDNDGHVMYAHPEFIKRYPAITESDWENSGKDFYEVLMNEMPSIPFSISIFRYKGDACLAIFVQALISAQAKALDTSVKLVWIFYLGFILIPVLSMAFLTRPMAKSILSLENAAGEIGRGNWDVEIPPFSKKKKHPFTHLIRAFDQMRQELKDNHDRQQRIMMSISHDLKTPLTSIKGYVEALQDGMAQSQEELNHYTNVIMEKTNLLEERISDLIHFSRLQTTEWKNRFSDFSLRELFDEVAGIFRNDALIRKRNIIIKSEISDEALFKGDRRMIFRVLENLFDNACRYTDPGDTIRFSLNANEKSWVISMEDSGPGIEKEHIPHIFDNFYRADSGRNTRGIGVGLASAKTIVESHGGSIRYSETNLGGACFLIELPRSL